MSDPAALRTTLVFDGLDAHELDGLLRCPHVDTGGVAITAWSPVSGATRFRVSIPVRDSSTTKAIQDALAVFVERRHHPSGAELIATERAQQVRDGFTAEHDDRHADGELVDAAAYYLEPFLGVKEVHYWPWNGGGPKRAADDRGLVKAGALIAAELDRRARAQ